MVSGVAHGVYTTHRVYPLATVPVAGSKESPVITESVADRVAEGRTRAQSFTVERAAQALERLVRSE